MLSAVCLRTALASNCSMVEDDSELKPRLGIYYTHTFNRLDKVQTMTLVMEYPFQVTFSITTSLQPVIKYYPNFFSRKFVNTMSGFKPHYAMLFQIGNIFLVRL